MVALLRLRRLLVGLLDRFGLRRAVELIVAPVRVPLLRHKTRVFYRRQVRRGDLVFDIGANNGEHATILAKLGARVVAVEPQRSCIARLEKRLPGHTVVRAAVADKAGYADLHLSRASDERATLSTEWIGSGRFAAGEWVGVEQVPVETLDSLISRFGLPDFCKIDVEGSEEKVLAGLSVPVRRLSFEFAHESLAATLRCIDMLEQLGRYRYGYRLGTSSRIRTVGDAAAIRRKLETMRPGGYGDIVARLG